MQKIRGKTMKLSNTDINLRMFYSIRFVSECAEKRGWGVVDIELEKLNDSSEHLRLYPILVNDEVCYHFDVWWDSYCVDFLEWAGIEYEVILDEEVDHEQNQPPANFANLLILTMRK
jgi:hypothetical protein